MAGHEMGMSLDSKLASGKFVISSTSHFTTGKPALLLYSSKCHYLAIEHEQQTASAYLLFVSHIKTKERVVIKILQDNRVTRYNLA